MIDIQNFALDGLYPGKVSTFSIAISGQFQTEIIIQPVVQSAGGGWVPTPLHMPAQAYRVTVRIKYKDKWYEDTQIMSESKARVLAELKGIKSFSTGNIMVSVNGIQIHEQKEILVTVNRIGTIKANSIICN